MQLGVNIDHVATLRQARKIGIPDPIQAAEICERTGCDSIVCHLREDRRHINDSDLINLRRIVKTRLNLEMSCAQEIVEIACKVLPDQATLVPERREEITTEGGLNLVDHQNRIKEVVATLRSCGIRVSLFIDPETTQIEMAQQLGVQSIELHTGKYADCKGEDELKRQLEILKKSAGLGQRLGLKVFAGHGLNYENVKTVAQIQGIEELNIGHSIISRAVFVGLENAVKKMLALIK
ncbi:MAG: pyridoxine 5'-phosphate synthase [Candidatus Omnitrophica bacterium]|nr:pyridoxine 5'-phosphate synthase [Candidatus Omnitrophota bacterium]